MKWAQNFREGGSGRLGGDKAIFSQDPFFLGGNFLNHFYLAAQKGLADRFGGTHIVNVAKGLGIIGIQEKAEDALGGWADLGVGLGLA
ncbi:MAG: hypothetical protein HC818_07880 [Synechococcaceae cyanobacterium RM1_1_27]|nr:hypothetical protein [Synechococcaceae cyanobacterium RM1_1_27]